MNVDPLAEVTMQPYAYTNNNPIRFADPTGMIGEDFVQRKDSSIYWDNNANSQSTTKAGETYLGKELSFTLSKIDENLELLFPVNHNEISNYQIEYFKEIENNWDSILQQLKHNESQIDFENYRIVSIMIPDKNDEFYDVDAEIVFKKNGNIISVILNNLIVEEVIEI